MKSTSRVHVRFLDILIFVLAILLVVGTAILVLDRQSGARYVEITGEKGEWIAPLDKEADYEITGPLGMTHVHIHNGKASITESPCSNKLCVLAGSISEPNQWIACLPNKVFVRITSNGNSKDVGGVDASTY
ncbi:MAG TPA: NusG domain II-containing protein [Rectinema sp.]|nr:NusG domain II-containing protein [Rectinema sp.]